MTLLALFIWLIIRLIQLVFSAGTVFFSHKKSVNSVFQPAYNSSRTAPLLLLDAGAGTNARPRLVSSVKF
jgi:hypothetical protein